MRAGKEGAPLGLGGNALWNVSVGLAWPTMLMIVTTRIFVAELGVRLYGVYAVINSTLALAGLLRVGMNEATVKYVAEYRSSNDRCELASVVCATFGAYAVVALIGGLGILASGGWLASSLLHGGPDTELAGRALRVSAFGFPATLLVSASVAVFAGFERYDTASVTSAAVVTVPAVAGMATLGAGGSLLALVAANVAGLWVVALAAAVWAWKWVGVGNVALARLPATFRRILGFSLYSALNNVASTLFSAGDRLVVGAVVGPEAVAYYSVGASVGSRIYTTALAVTHVLLPRFSAYGADGEGEEKQRHLFWTSVALVAVFASTATAAVVALGRPALEVWLGARFAAGAIWPLEVAALTYSALSIHLVAFYYLNGTGVPAVAALWYMSGGVSSLAAMWGGGVLWGLPGVLLGTLVFPVVLVGSFRAASRRVGAGPGQRRDCLGAAAVAAAIGVCSAGVGRALGGLVLPPSRSGWLALATSSLGFCAVLLAFAVSFAGRPIFPLLEPVRLTLRRKLRSAVAVREGLWRGRIWK